MLGARAIKRAESQAAWESFLWNLHERGLAGSHLQRVLSDGCCRWVLLLPEL